MSEVKKYIKLLEEHELRKIELDAKCADELICNLAKNLNKWSMSIPPQDFDTDMILIRQVRTHIPILISNINKLKAEHEKLKIKLEQLEGTTQNAFERWQNALDREEKLTQDLASAKELIGKLKLSFEHSLDFDSSPRFGYEYGQEVNGRKPAAGERWLTPKEESRNALKKIEQWEARNGTN